MDLRQLTAKLNQIENNKLYEGLTLTEAKSVRLWESAGRAIKEAALTPDQIQQLFTSIEQGATDSGSNRTMLGKGKDAAEAVNKAWEDLKTKIQNSGPIQNVDNTYDSAVAKIEAGLGGPDNAVSKMIMKYREFAKKHPIAQGFIYAALIAAAGISGAGLGGAAVLGLLKMADKLLQGEKFSSAAYSGAKTGATAYAAGQIGQALKGTPQDAPAGGSTWADKQYDKLAGQHADAAVRVGGRAARDAIAKGAMDAADEAIRAGAVTDYNSMTDTVAEIMSRYEGTAPISPQSLQTIEQMVRLKLQAGMVGGNGVLQGGKAVASAVANSMNESINLSEAQIQKVFIFIDDTVIIEGIMDKVKQFGKNLTTKITANKLNKAWSKAGSPTDSNEVAKILQDTGVDPKIVNSVYTQLQIPAPQSVNTSDPLADIQAQFAKLDPASQKELLAYLQK
jgi:hypothetical protein